MLSQEAIDRIIDKVVSRMEETNTFVLKQIAKDLKTIGDISPTKAFELGQAFKYGGSYQKILQKLSQETAMSVQEIEEIFKAVAKRDYQFAKQFYDYRGMDYIPYEDNIALQRQVQALANITAREFINIANTSAIGFNIKDVNGKEVFKDISKAYETTIDRAILSVSQGKSTFDKELTRIVNELGSSGLKTIEYASGRTRRLDSAVRMNLQQGLREMHNETQEMVGAQYNADGVEISVHENPAIDHELVQGRQFSKEEYALLNSGMSAKDYKGNTYTLDHNHDGSIRQISTLNCYHTIFNIVLGVNKPEYTDKQLQDILNRNEKGFDFDGRHYTMYEGTQLQRRLETEIRKQKDIQIMAKESGDNENLVKSQSKITSLTRKYNELCETSGLKRKADRLKVSGYKRASIKS